MPVMVVTVFPPRPLRSRRITILPHWVNDNGDGDGDWGGGEIEGADVAEDEDDDDDGATSSTRCARSGNAPNGLWNGCVLGAVRGTLVLLGLAMGIPITMANPIWHAQPRIRQRGFRRKNRKKMDLSP